MNRKTESLSYPTNPLAAIRELQELDAPPKTVSKANQSQKPAIVALPTSSEVASATGSDETGATSSEESSAPQVKKRRAGPSRKEDGHKQELSETAGPMAGAVREMLSQPYTADPRKGPFTVSTVKIPTEVSERLGWVSALTGKAKQEILAEALKDYFDKVLKEG
jgi:hypothetical protein